MGARSKKRSLLLVCSTFDVGIGTTDRCLFSCSSGINWDSDKVSTPTFSLRFSYGHT